MAHLLPWSCEDSVTREGGEPGFPSTETDPAQESDKQKTEAAAADTDERPSDALATGQTLYVLSMVGVPPQELAIQRALAFLVRTQTKDGSWRVPIRSQKNSGTALSHYGTGWAAIGIMQTLPAPATRQDNP